MASAREGLIESKEGPKKGWCINFNQPLKKRDRIASLSAIMAFFSFGLLTYFQVSKSHLRGVLSETDANLEKLSANFTAENDASKMTAWNSQLDCECVFTCLSRRDGARTDISDYDTNYHFDFCGRDSDSGWDASVKICHGKMISYSDGCPGLRPSSQVDLCKEICPILKYDGQAYLNLTQEAGFLRGCVDEQVSTGILSGTAILGVFGALYQTCMKRKERREALGNSQDPALEAARDETNRNFQPL
jgi:hypothetical protein